MKYFNYLKKIFLVYLISGIVLGVTISSLIVIHKYNDHLVKTLGIIRTLSDSKDKIKIQINKMDEWRKYLREDLRLDTADSEILLFQSLDDIKTNMKGASIIVGALEESNGERGLPVKITVPAKNYKMLIDYAGYIESLSIPRYKVNRLSISKESGEDIILDIEGSLRMPSVGSYGR